VRAARYISCGSLQIGLCGKCGCIGWIFFLIQSCAKGAKKKEKKRMMPDEKQRF
jgi:hypothetical protein